MYRMYTTPGPDFQDFLGKDVMPRRNYLGEEQELFLCEYAKTILYIKQKHIGMLSPLAYPFYPSTENRMEINIKTTKEKEKENKDKHLKT